MITPLSTSSLDQDTFSHGIGGQNEFSDFLEAATLGLSQDLSKAPEEAVSFTDTEADYVAQLLDVYAKLSTEDMEGDVGQTILGELAANDIRTPDALMKMPPSTEFVVRMLGWPEPASESWTQEKIEGMLSSLQPPIELPQDFWDKPLGDNQAILKKLAEGNGPPPLDLSSPEFQSQPPEIRSGTLYQLLSDYHANGDGSALPQLFEALGISEGVDANKLVEAIFGPRNAPLHREDSTRNFQNFVTRLHGYAYEDVNSTTLSNYSGFMSEHGIRDYRTDENGDYSTVADRLLVFLKVDVNSPQGDIEYGPSHEVPDPRDAKPGEWDGITHILDENGKPIPAVFNENGDLVPWQGES